jgi:hypothetical protein
MVPHDGMFVMIPQGSVVGGQVILNEKILEFVGLSLLLSNKK